MQLILGCGIADVDCQRGDGSTYHGKKNDVSAGKCRTWDDKRNYADRPKWSLCIPSNCNSLAPSGYFLGHNYCRNPGPPGYTNDDLLRGVWCYSKHGWEKCEVKQCEAGCDKGKSKLGLNWAKLRLLDCSWQV